MVNPPLSFEWLHCKNSLFVVNFLFSRENLSNKNAALVVTFAFEIWLNVRFTKHKSFECRVMLRNIKQKEHFKTRKTQNNVFSAESFLKKLKQPKVKRFVKSKNTWNNFSNTLWVKKFLFFLYWSLKMTYKTLSILNSSLIIKKTLIWKNLDFIYYYKLHLMYVKRFSFINWFLRLQDFKNINNYDLNEPNRLKGPVSEITLRHCL